jgi:SPP1 family predicted phage head-tail adaptor
MRTGDLDIRITVRQRGTLDAFGQPTVPTNVATLWAKRQHQRGREVISTGQVGGEQIETFTIRWRSDIEPKMFVEWQGKTYEIQNVVEAERRVWLDLVCQRWQ